MTSSAFKHSDFVLVCQQQGDIKLVISIVDSRVAESSGQMILLPVVVPVSKLVCTKSKHTDLITYVDGKKQAEEACRRISSMTIQPGLVDIFEKCWTVDQYLIFVCLYPGHDR